MKLPPGFTYAGVACGIKASGRPDLALIRCDPPAVAAGVYTQNVVCAPPVHLDRSRTPLADCLGVVINSGNANACTGDQGMQDAIAMADQAGEAMGGCGQKVLVMSTGIIGQRLPMHAIREGIRSAAAGLGSETGDFQRAAEAILTTDKGTKTAARAAGPFQLAAMAKGAGMIGPKMATMLAVVMTDAQLAPATAQQMLEAAADVSFNCVRVEGHTSTNDTMLLLASGQAGPPDDAQQAELQIKLNQMCIELAKQIPADGEGATHLMEVQVTGSDCTAEARRIAEAVADSPLVKTAITGNDPNWGRICSAAGYAGVPFPIEQLSLTLNGIDLFRHGEPVAFDEAAASKSMQSSDCVSIKLVVGDGAGKATIWASDLTVEYVKFNSEYTT